MFVNVESIDRHDGKDSWWSKTLFTIPTLFKMFTNFTNTIIVISFHNNTSLFTDFQSSSISRSAAMPAMHSSAPPITHARAVPQLSIKLLSPCNYSSSICTTMSKHSIHVRVGPPLSSVIKVDMRSPQESALPPFLFLLMVSGFPGDSRYSGAAEPPGRLTPQYRARWVRPTRLTPQYFGWLSNLYGAFCSIFQPIIISVEKNFHAHRVAVMHKC